MMTVATPPNDFLCPITKQIMTDPVVTHNGKSFERTAIIKWIEQDGNNYCPVTGAPLRATSLESNKSLQWKIRYWMMKNKYEEHDADAQHKNVVVVKQQDKECVTRIPLEKFLCPLTRKIMKYPVMTRDGYNFERNAIMKWMAMRGEVCPISGKSLKPSDLVPNTKLQWEIQKWEQQDDDSRRAAVITTSSFQQTKLKESIHSEPVKQQQQQQQQQQSQNTRLALNTTVTKQTKKRVEIAEDEVQQPFSVSRRLPLFLKKFSRQSTLKTEEDEDDFQDTTSLCSSNVTPIRRELVC